MNLFDRLCFHRILLLRCLVSFSRNLCTLLRKHLIGHNHICDIHRSLVRGFAPVEYFQDLLEFLYCHSSIFRCFFNRHAALSHQLNQHPHEGREEVKRRWVPFWRCCRSTRAFVRIFLQETRTNIANEVVYHGERLRLFWQRQYRICPL